MVETEGLVEQMETLVQVEVPQVQQETFLKISFLMLVVLELLVQVEKEMFRQVQVVVVSYFIMKTI